MQTGLISKEINHGRTPQMRPRLHGIGSALPQFYSVSYFVRKYKVPLQRKSRVSNFERNKTTFPDEPKWGIQSLDIFFSFQS